jgi:LPXTG-motif cell wall-anchored protein
MITFIAVSATTASADASVTICHATASNGNPYVSFVNLDESAVDGVGSGDHFGEHTGPVWDPTLKAQHITWGDIIPPVDGVHAGLNWTAAGEAIWNNDCQPVTAAPTGSVSLAKVTSGANAPAAGTEFTFTVTCESGTPTSPVQIASGASATTVATGVAEDDTCTITETVSLGAASTAYTGTGVVQTGAQAVVTVVADATAAVTATNSFPTLGCQVNCGPPEPEPEPEVEPVDECPDQEGFQDNPDQCLLVLPEVIEPPAEPPAVAPTEVLGEVIVQAPAQLPRTGATTLPLLAVGLSLILFGAGAVLFGRERTALT